MRVRHLVHVREEPVHLVLALSAGAAPTVAVTVDAGTSLGTVPSTGVGLNTAVYDAYMNDAKAASLMKAAGVRQLRFPGGSVADAYHWKTHTVTGGSWAAPGTDFDHFMATAKRVGAQPIITANYGLNEVGQPHTSVSDPS
ncbi:hypothetical protein SAMN06272765_2389 [Streptomyces sp. Ag109_G2-15]|nr:hypothetical protein SAMN06272765_2389 [Streptomyces sp. Ag109_G2-15]